jgi:hypothetical protein
MKADVVALLARAIVNMRWETLHKSHFGQWLGLTTTDGGSDDIIYVELDSPCGSEISSA